MLTCRPIVAACALTVVLHAQPEPATRCDATPLLIRNANVWTPRVTLANRDVLVRGGRIASIDRASSRRREGIRTIDAAGHTLLPGLIDSHLHFVVPGGLPADGAPRRDAAEITGRQLLRSGVTSGRLHLAALEEAVELKSRSLAACAPMPRLQVGGPGLSGTSDRDTGNFQGAASPAAAAAKVERFRAAGLDWVAIHGSDRFQPGVLEALRAAARRVGLRIMAAGTSPAETSAALRLNPDTLDYLDGSPEPLYAAATLDAIRPRRDLVVVPTPGVTYRGAAYARDPALLERPGNFLFLADADRRFVVEAATKSLDGPEGDRVRQRMATLAAKFAQLRRLGVPMAVGSDAGSPLHFQAGAIWWELEAWRSLGASHREALIAATEHGARVLAAGDVGHLRAGARADFVLYRGTVESGPFDGDRVLAVAKDGVLYVEGGTWLGS